MSGRPEAAEIQPHAGQQLAGYLNLGPCPMDTTKTHLGAVYVSTSQPLTMTMAFPPDEPFQMHHCHDTEAVERCSTCGAPWQPVRRGECLHCGSDAGPERRDTEAGDGR